MDLLREIFTNEVFPAIGCTEPISCAYAAAAAAEQLQGIPDTIDILVDAGTFKNGAAVTVPNSGGEKGNVIASALGAVIGRSGLRLEILKDVTPDTLARARQLVETGAVSYGCKEDEKGFHVEVSARRNGSHVRCIVSEGHTNITCLEKDGMSIVDTHPHGGTKDATYRDVMQKMKLEEVLRDATRLDEGQRAYIQRGIDMNMTIAEKGIDMKRTGYQLRQMMRDGLKADDLFYQVKLRVACAVDARMGGMPEPVMTSGGSGNQGTLTVIAPYVVGRHNGIDIGRIQESIAVSHAVNSYVKCFTGELSVICGCAIAASIASAVAMVYQKAGIDMAKIGLAMDNVIGDLCGIICDGAKPGCSMKIMSGAETAMRSAFMALSGYGLSSEDGMLGRSPEESILNIGKISLQGMFAVDPTVVHIIQDKSSRRGLA
ncbi:MAG TPA: L-serine ammonia-lyase, iron-sulfur-dependent, subunit alpha [Deltaproteobacteria bacterium]|nr:L-serine ammonia-lyase, iron-sulfur-dependent, subunit alpha [Deltaproteobacteria bacterium]HPR54035.1 L-serine ammonia-lyase, iron-sulfur-dependent, subunit alpha [Deltaproteobacteria bacterium]HXK46815.1 L-serine ammonia-lyase, iron-sulfur-dependent, subunit alpha [Deltaproteobacteria bacterium]